MKQKIRVLFITYVLSSLIYITSNANPIATNFMLLNNYNVRQVTTIWDRFRAGFKLNHQETALVKYYEKLYTKNPNHFYQLLKNAQPYLYYLLTQTERYGIPSEVALIPAVESNYNPLAKNPTDDYAGMWQFVPSTGRRFNLAQNRNIDERRNIIKSSQSALIYLIYLFSMFKQWDVAIGAYNWGEGNMYNAILNSKQPIGQVNYNKLRLRKITAHYLPKVIALANIIENPAKFNIKLARIPNKPFFAIISPEKEVTISSFNTQASISKLDFFILNPEFKNTSFLINSQNLILLPIQNQNIYYASINKDNSNFTNSSPDQIELVADNSKLTNSDIAKIQTTQIVTNGKSDKATFNNKEEQEIIDILVDNINTKSNNNSTNSSQRKQIKEIKYQVNTGDTLYPISRKFKVKIEQIRKDNNIPDNSLTVGQILRIKS